MRPAWSDITREEIAAVKAQLRRAGSKAYAKLVPAALHPDAPGRLRAFPDTRRLQRISLLLGWCFPVLALAAPLALLVTASWLRALALVAVVLLILNSARTEVNLELGARLLAAERRVRGSRPDGGDGREG